MASEEASTNEVARKTAPATPSDETIAAALEEALQNARLLRVSSSIFLKEARELLDTGRAAALLWAADCLEGLNEVERERLAGVKEATEHNSVPLVPVQSKKQLAEWVGLGKIGRLRRNPACLLAVVLHSADGADTDEAPALSKLLENYPQAPKPLPKPIVTQRVSSAGSKVTTPSSAKAHARHSYTPDAASFRGALSGKDTLPVLKRTGSSAPGSRRESADGGSTLPAWALSRRESLAASGADVTEAPAASKAATSAPLEQAPASSKASASAAAEDAASCEPEAAAVTTASAASPKGVASSDGKATTPREKAAAASGSAASKDAAVAGPVSKVEPAASSAEEAAEPAPEKDGPSKPLLTRIAPRSNPPPPAATVNGKTSPAEAAAVPKTAVSPSPTPAEPAQPEAPATAPKEATAAAPEKATPATAEKAQTADAATPAAKPAPASDPFTPGAGLPSSANSDAATTAKPEATPSETVALGGRSASVARPEEVSAFRMSRRKRTGSNAASATPAAGAADKAADGLAENGSAAAAAAEEGK